MVTTTRPGLALARRFVAGDTLDDAISAASRINAEGLRVSLDHLGEEVHDRESAIQATDEYLVSLHRIADEGLDANISIKPTQLGLAIDNGIALESIGRLAEGAMETGTTVTIDMEDSRYTEATIELYEKAQTEYGNLGIAVQTYLYRTPGDVERLVPLEGHIRICKGAYVESSHIAHQSKDDVDAAYVALLRTLMASEQVRPAVATHDGELIDLTRRLSKQRVNYFEFQMLYGVRSELQRQLVVEGFPVRVYLPYGSQWYPYLTRRLAERPANAWFFVRAALGG
ncbi:MAG: proline dehydrogenase family protein [Deltaproteobacteria bacterium]|nr:proline dehydrogenase family protein [Deltaproteobacteria bacterium]